MISHRGISFLLVSVAVVANAQVDPIEHQQFADDLTAIIHTNENDCSSALGVSMALSLVYPGTTNEGIVQLRDTLNYPDGSNIKLVWENTTQNMMSNADGTCLWEYMGECESQKPLLKIANSVWYDDGNTLNADYERVVGQYAMQTDFEADESPIIVNKWVEDSTNGLIDSIVPEDKPLFPPYILLAINSIYLKASWAEQFQERLTNLDTFYDSSSKSNEVGTAHFMHIVENFMYSHDALSGYQVISLPFADSMMSMLFVLPMIDSASLATSTDVISAAKNLQYTRVALALPKFKFETTYESALKEALFDLGIQAPFTDGTRAICGLFEDTTGCENIIIDKIIQKTVIDCNEKGVEAAAVTMVGAVATSVGPPPEDPTLMILDHPFQFFIYDKTEDLVLFEGSVGNPGIPEGEPEIDLLDAVHSESDFWSKNLYVNPVVSETTSEYESMSDCARVRCANPCLEASCNEDESCETCTEEDCTPTCTAGGDVCAGFKCVANGTINSGTGEPYLPESANPTGAPPITASPTTISPITASPTLSSPTITNPTSSTTTGTPTTTKPSLVPTSQPSPSPTSQVSACVAISCLNPCEEASCSEDESCEACTTMECTPSCTAGDIVCAGWKCVPNNTSSLPNNVFMSSNTTNPTGPPTVASSTINSGTEEPENTPDDTSSSPTDGPVNTSAGFECARLFSVCISFLLAFTLVLVW